MALAVLRYAGRDGNGSHFRFDIGKNRYYRYAVGAKSGPAGSGLKLLQSPNFQSELVGPLPDRAMGRGVLTVPAEAFDRENRTVQLLSFRSQDLTGPAVSDAVRVPLGSGDLEPPAMQFSARGNPGGVPMSDRASIETVPLRYREASYSNAMFLGALAGLLPSLLPKVAPFVGSLLGGLGKGGSGAPAGGAPGAITRAVGDPQVVELLTQLLAEVAKATTATAAPAGTATPAAAAPAAGAAKPGAAPEKKETEAVPKAAALGRRSRRLSRSRSADYSEALVAPALLAALPALMPLLKQVLTPQTIQSVVGAPQKLAQTAISGIKDFAKLGLKADEQFLAHLRAIHPSIDDPALDALLMSMSVGLSAPAKDLDYRRVSSVTLDFAGVTSVSLYGTTRVLYAAGRDLAFPLTVATPRPFRDAIVELRIKDAETLEVVAGRRQKVEAVDSGPLPVVPSIPAARLADLETGRDYLVCAALVWKNKSGSRRGTSRQQRIHLAGEYAFDRVEESNELIPLSDVTAYREFWHKLWEGTFADGIKRYELICKYYYVLDPKRTDNARIRTKVRLEEGDRRRTGKLLSGMELSPVALNRLVPRLAPGSQPLTEAELAALRGADFVDRFNQAARYQAKLRGRTGDRGALWLFPEVKLQNVVLQKAQDVNVHGNVTSLAEHRVAFPMPAVVHFIGARSQ